MQWKRQKMVVDVEIREYKRIDLDRSEQSQQRYMGPLN